MAAPPAPQSSSKLSRERFLAVWPAIKDELVDYLKAEKMPAEAQAWYDKVSRPFLELSDTYRRTLTRSRAGDC